MENTQQLQVILNKLASRVKFGLYESGRCCYFEDATKVYYHDLWDAVRIANKMERGHKKNLAELYPDLFLGVFPHKFQRHKSTKRLLLSMFGIM